MLTKNFYNALACTTCKKDLAKSLVMYDGTEARANGILGYVFDCFGSMNLIKLTHNQSGVRLGTGQTPATADDYCLESPLDSASISATYQSTSVIGRDDDCVYLSATYGVTNLTNVPMPIREIGLFYDIKTSATGTVANCLLERTVLETPIVIPVGESRQITYTISFRYPK